MLPLVDSDSPSTWPELSLPPVAVTWASGNVLLHAAPGFKPRSQTRGSLPLAGGAVLPLHAGIPVVVLLLLVMMKRRTIAACWSDAMTRRCRVAPQDGSKEAPPAIPNPRDLKKALAKAWSSAAASRAPLSMLMIRVDHFEGFNSRYGTLEGEACLLRVVEMLRSALKPTDLLAQVSGSQFAILLPGCGVQACFQMAEQLRRRVVCAAVHHERSHWGLVTISVGCATMLPTPGGDCTHLRAEAEEALQEAQQCGCNRLMSPLTISPPLFGGAQPANQASETVRKGMRQAVAPAKRNKFSDAMWILHSARGQRSPSATMMRWMSFP